MLDETGKEFLERADKEELLANPKKTRAAIKETVGKAFDVKRFEAPEE